MPKSRPMPYIVVREFVSGLNEHTRILQALPEAVREKIGFKASG
jgi:hypothetical protein